MDDISAFGRRSVVTRVGEAGELTAPLVAEESADAAFTPADEKYATIAPIGKGGMGAVLLVEDRDLRREVAMKVLRDEIADTETGRRTAPINPRGC